MELDESGPLYDEATNLFLVSKRKSAPNRLLVGYCFKGTDLIVGESGRKKHAQASQSDIGGGEDGNYIIVSKCGSTTIIDTDHAGYHPVFYFHDGDFWAASNSIAGIVEHLREHGVPVRPYLPQLATTGIDFFPLHQLSSFRTCVEGVHLLPVGHRLIVKPDGSHIEQRALKSSAVDYRAALVDFVEVWCGRILTLAASDGVKILVDLTAGLDSRTVLSLFLLAMRGAPAEVKGRIGIVSYEAGNSVLDVPIAREILETVRSESLGNLDWRISSDPNDGFSGLRLIDGLTAFKRWRLKTNGIYSPIYMSQEQPDFRHVRFRGGSGENSRHFYKKYFPTPRLFAACCCRRIEHPEFADGLRGDILGAFDFISNSSRVGNADPLILHYREFRSRFHGGLRSNFAFSFMPLGSRYFDAASALLPADALEEGQIFYDVMNCAYASLLDIRFDSDAKRPSDNVRRRLVAVANTEAGSTGGRIFGAFDSTVGGRKLHSPGHWEELQRAVTTATEDAFVREFCGEDAVVSARAMTARAVQRGAFASRNAASIVSGVIAAAMFGQQL